MSPFRSYSSVNLKRHNLNDGSSSEDDMKINGYFSPHVSKTGNLLDFEGLASNKLE